MNRDVVAAREMAEHFEVSTRTIQRDMETLALAGIPLLSLRGAQGGYGIMDGYKLDRQLVNTHDLFFILTSLESISSTLSNKEMGMTLEKMKTLVRDYQQKEIASRKEQFHIDFSAFSIGKNSKELFALLQRGIEMCFLIEFSYIDSNFKSTSRVIEPMAILFKWFSWYLYGFCCLRKDYRIFRLSRMQDVQITDTHFTRKNKGLARFLEEIEATSSHYSEDIVLKFHSSAETHIEDYLQGSKMNNDSDGNIILHLQMPENEWLYSMILSYGDMVEVLAPAHLREIIREKSLNILKKYLT
jgi:predicted DNA-binding transcriptional regulator YafY